MVRLNLIISGLAGCLLAVSPVAASDYTELTLVFSSSAAIQPSTAPSLVTPPALEENDVLAPGDLFKISSVSTAPQQGSLFRNADLILSIQSSSNNIAHAEVLGHCSSLDLVADLGMFGAGAECDSQAFSYTVNGNSIIVLKDNSVFRQYELAPGNYMINGYPVIFN